MYVRPIVPSPKTQAILYSLCVYSINYLRILMASSYTYSIVSQIEFSWCAYQSQCQPVDRLEPTKYQLGVLLTCRRMVGYLLMQYRYCFLIWQVSTQISDWYVAFYCIWRFVGRGGIFFLVVVFLFVQHDYQQHIEIRRVYRGVAGWFEYRQSNNSLQEQSIWFTSDENLTLSKNFVVVCHWVVLGIWVVCLRLLRKRNIFNVCFYIDPIVGPMRRWSFVAVSLSSGWMMQGIL